MIQKWFHVLFFKSRNWPPYHLFFPDVSCGLADKTTNADIKYDGDGFGKIARYSCRVGYFMASGNSFKTCTGGGTWSGITPQCQRKLHFITSDLFFFHSCFNSKQPDYG